MRLNDAIRRPVVHLARPKKRKAHGEGREDSVEKPGTLRLLATMVFTRGKSTPS